MAATAASELFSADVLDGKIFSGGWIAGSERLATTEPATGEQLAEVGAATPQDVHRAAEIAGEAQTAWAATDPHDRAAILLRAADVIEANKDEIIGWIVRETGSIPPKADFEIGLASAELKEAAALAPRMRGEVIPEPEGKLSIAQRVPIGVVGVIAPWNVPLVLAMRSVAPALALGNAVILKPDPDTPVAAASASRASSRRPGCPRASCTCCRAARTPARRCAPRRRWGWSRSPARPRPGASRRDLRGAPQEGRPGAGRQELVHRAGGRRSGRGGLVGRVGLVPAPGPDLHGLRAPPRARAGRRRYLEKLAAKAAHLPVGNPATRAGRRWGRSSTTGSSRRCRASSPRRSPRARRCWPAARAGALLPGHRAGGDDADMRGWKEEIFGPVAPVMTFSDDDEAIARQRHRVRAVQRGVHLRHGARPAHRVRRCAAAWRTSTTRRSTTTRASLRRDRRVGQRRPLRRRRQPRRVQPVALDDRARDAGRLPVLGGAVASALYAGPP